MNIDKLVHELKLAIEGYQVYVDYLDSNEPEEFLDMLLERDQIEHLMQVLKHNDQTTYRRFLSKLRRADNGLKRHAESTNCSTYVPDNIRHHKKSTQGLVVGFERNTGKGAKGPEEAQRRAVSHIRES
ncbi:MAG: hypothetical protein HY051_01325 [Candidatus Aenigmarchaeota archaeon]|nr:hypothetical protein [Candidatus Aenigmarchaeota archaeon]